MLLLESSKILKVCKNCTTDLTVSVSLDEPGRRRYAWSVVVVVYRLPWPLFVVVGSLIIPLLIHQPAWKRMCELPKLIVHWTRISMYIGYWTLKQLLLLYLHLASSSITPAGSVPKSRGWQCGAWTECKLYCLDFSMRLFCFVQAKTLCMYGCVYLFAALVLVYVDVMVVSSA